MWNHYGVRQVFCQGTPASAAVPSMNASDFLKQNLHLSRVLLVTSAIESSDIRAGQWRTRQITDQMLRFLMSIRFTGPVGTKKGLPVREPFLESARFA